MEVDCQQLFTDLDLALLPKMPNRVTPCIRLGDYFQLNPIFPSQPTASRQGF